MNGSSLVVVLVVLIGAMLFWPWYTAGVTPVEVVLELTGRRAPAPSIDAQSPAQAAARATATPRPRPSATPAPSPTPAAFCSAGESARFAADFAKLKQELGATMGDPRECEHVDTTSGNTLQLTTTGLALQEKGSGLLQFSDGYRHWALTSKGVVQWVGDTRPAGLPTQPPALSGERMRVAHTDGLGVILWRTASAQERIGAALAEGAQVTVLERNDSGWVRVHSQDGREGWVPAKYLEPAT
jgi:hypothetical protein